MVPREVRFLNPKSSPQPRTFADDPNVGEDLLQAWRKFTNDAPVESARVGAFMESELFREFLERHPRFPDSYSKNNANGRSNVKQKLKNTEDTEKKATVSIKIIISESE